MALLTLDTITHNADDTVTKGTIQVDPTSPAVLAGLAAAAARRAATRTRPLDGKIFLARMTDAEYTGIMAAAAKNVRLTRWVEDLRMTGTINVNDTTAQAAKAAVVAGGLLTQARADIIFAS